MSVNAGMVTLRLFGALRDVARQREVELPCAGETVEKALAIFVDQFGERVSRFIFDAQGKRWQSVILLLNEEPIEDSQQTRLKPGDVISLLLPLAGGSQDDIRL